MRTLDFTPSDSSFPVKLPSLRSCDTFRSLPTQLLSGTLRNLSVLKNLSQLYLTAVKTVVPEPVEGLIRFSSHP